MSKLYRCSRESCKQRRKLHKPPEQYARPPVCPSCKGTAFRRDLFQERVNAMSKCTCDGRHFPHRRGSKGCREYVGTYTDEELESQYRSYT